jgi:hypothetical protein
MKAIVVYESFWGNTAAVARAIAEGIGGETQALSTSEATGATLSGVDLIVAGCPIITFRLPNDEILKDLKANQSGGANPPDLSQPSMRTWLNALPKGNGRAAGFETRVWWSLGSSAGAILKELEKAGYRPLDKPQRFIVKGAVGPLKEGELEKARQWGAQLARAMG